MRILLDTHVFLWYISADPKLPATFHEAITNQENDVFLSVASVWEAVIKHGLGKLPFPEPPSEFLPRQRARHGIATLAIDEGALACLSRLPALHRDPFDRILVAQAIQHGLTLLAVDEMIAKYVVPRLQLP